MGVAGVPSSAAVMMSWMQLAPEKMLPMQFTPSQHLRQQSMASVAVVTWDVVPAESGPFAGLYVAAPVQ